jgi:HNH endonuclease
VVKQKHLQWFDSGARSLRALARERGFEGIFPTGEDWYLCPLCLDVLLTVEEFGTGDLTVEHAPPEALGGRDLALTCKACNSRAGSKFDAEAHKQERLSQFLSGQSGRPETVAFTVGASTARVEMHAMGPAGMLLIVVPQINNPADLELLEQHMHTLSGAGSTDFRFTVTPRLRYFPDRARVSWIRAAYLAAFALFGWRYILQPALQPVRDQFQHPQAVTLPRLSMYNPQADPDRHELWIIKQPAEHQSLLAVWGQHGVFLPLPNDTRSVEELARSLGADGDQPVHYAFTGDMLPWPSGPEHLLDPSPAAVPPR